EPSRLEVKPGEERKINCLIEVPPNARTGSYNGVVFFEAVVGKVEGAGISGRVGSVFNIQVLKARKSLIGEENNWFWTILVAILVPILALVIVFWDKIIGLSLKAEKEHFKEES
ncbi:MAG: hypothetical protein Q8M92_07715, partial [Candidatus Subteraquimicrobiales bacterium]|nr:hypothetical protein [Candidatus Subteraquimicrobiales bacterium]